MFETKFWKTQSNIFFKFQDKISTLMYTVIL